MFTITRSDEILAKKFIFPFTKDELPKVPELLEVTDQTLIDKISVCQTPKPKKPSHKAGNANGHPPKEGESNGQTRVIDGKGTAAAAAATEEVLQGEGTSKKHDGKAGSKSGDKKPESHDVNQ